MTQGETIMSIVVEVYHKESDFHPVLSETYVGGKIYINHKEKVLYINQESDWNTIHFSEIECNHTNRHYIVYKE